MSGKEKAKKTIEKLVKGGAAALVGVLVAKNIPPDVAVQVVDPLAAAVIAGATYGATLLGALASLKFKQWFKF